jgi:hypothetical protein
MVAAVKGLQCISIHGLMLIKVSLLTDNKDELLDKETEGEPEVNYVSS